MTTDVTLKDVEAGARGKDAAPSASPPPKAPSRARSRSSRRGQSAGKFLTRSDTLAVLNRVLAQDGASSATGLEEGQANGGGAGAGGDNGTNPAPAASSEESPSLGQGQPLAFLQRLSERLQRAGLAFPGVELRWHDLQVAVDVPPRAAKAHNIFSALLAGFTGLLPRRAAAGDGDGPARRTVLDAGSGVLAPGRLCLLLGPPGAGKTTLLRVLAGQALPPPPEKSGGGGAERVTGGLRVRGGLLFNGLVPERDFEVGRSSSYVSQADTHIGEMTVEETLMFAAECLGPGLNEELHSLLREREAAAGISPDPELDALWEAAYGPHGHSLFVELFARLLGIDHVMATVVGNELLKGISGGQKRRVTAGEMAVGFANVMMLDEVTNGLDSNSALAIVRSLRNICKYVNATMVVSLLQPSPEVFECFDDVMLVSGGQLVFLGPREDVMPFFARLGLAPPPTKTDADFLQEVTATPAYQRRYWVAGGLAATCGHRWLSPRRLRQEFDRCWVGEKLASALKAPPASHELQDLVLHKERYALGTLAMWGAVLRREFLLFTRNKVFFIAGAVQIAFTAFLVSTTFIQLSTSSFPDANLFLSVMFFSLMTIFMGGFNFAPIYCQRLHVFYKQRTHRFYSPVAYAVGCCAMRLPELVLQSAVWAVMVYFSAGFAMDAGRFFIFFANLVAGGFYSVTIFELLGAITRNEVIAQGLGAVMLMLSVLASGFPIARTSIPGWWIWFYWINPMAWALRSMAVSELTAPQWATTSAAEYGEPDMSMGEYALEARGFYTSWAWVWAGLGAVVGESLLLLALQIAALTYMAPPSGYRPPPDDEDDMIPPPGLLRHDTSALPRSGTGIAAVPAIELSPAATAAATAGAGSGSPSAAEAGGSGSSRGTSAPTSGSAVTAAAGGEVVLHVNTNGGVPAASKGAAVATAAAAADRSASAKGGAIVNGGGANGGGTNLSFRPVVFAFEGVNYFVPNPKGAGELQLLSAVSGVFLPGVLTSLMGASGAGKTTLMDVLAGRKTGGRAEGRQVVNGAPKRMATFARQMGYVEQFDAHNPQATVLEALLFSARLRVPPGVLAAAAIRPYVEEVMQVVELGPLAQHTVGYGGGAGGGLSTEARKRLTIACELVANPAIVFLDEPTTGLDARAAGMVMRAVRNTAATGRTVVCTIHQPNREIMDFFDELLLLKPGGRVIYNGALGYGGKGGGAEAAAAPPAGAPGGAQARLISYLEAIQGVPRYQPLLNPADWMLEVTSPAAERQLGVDFAERWAASAEAAAAERRLQSYLVGGSGSLQAAARAGGGDDGAEAGADPEAAKAAAEADDAEAQRRFAQPLWRQYVLLCHRGVVSYWRMPAYNLLRLLVTIALGLALGTLYWGRGDNRTTLLGVLDIMGALYTTSLFLPMTNCLTVMPVVASDRAVFYRERSSGMYGSAVFAAAQGFTEAPFLFVQSVVYVCIVYSTTQFEFDSAKAMWFWLFIWLNLQCFTYLGMGAMNLTPNMPACVALTSLFVLLWNLFCGFLIYRDDIKPWWLWAYYFNPATYSIYGCITTQLGDVTDESIEVTAGNWMTVAQYVEQTFNYHYSMRGWLVLIMFGFIAFFRALSYLGLSKLNFQVR
ncbi:hypothetical protein HXX76_008097 [Chlamydomonas incerta]|uniref:ABC transporter domain-containing protein n=1 Tax=Chlamydomonas incerta TaxID=51695 RepID=A0A835SVB9_CHLIN|nr:hypothetical protein HXX76_008097 [Chlamydomonas incerta]|eukprot:KAG2433733.1 hypothetical protein HXX76_008097 [Chlamydomonas incerta]